MEGDVRTVSRDSEICMVPGAGICSCSPDDGGHNNSQFSKRSPQVTTGILYREKSLHTNQPTVGVVLNG